MIKTTKQNGAVLIIAILIAGVTLAIGFGVYNRTYKELLFVSFWKQAQAAFSAADSGLECVMYWDTHPAANYACFGNVAAAWPAIPVGTTAVLSMTVYTGCVSVEITKNAAYPFTTIRSRGYNTCTTTDPRRVERGIRIDY